MVPARAIDAAARAHAMHASHTTHAQTWRTALTFADLCALGERFVRGELRAFPGWGAPELDVESDALAPALAACQRAGFLTLASQPGVAGARDHDDRVRAQRAFVCGFAPEKSAGRLALLRDAAEFDVRAFRRGDALGAELAVSTRDGVPYAFAGYNAFEDELALFAPSLSPSAIAELERCVYVSLVDLTWGRADVLFRRVVAALEAR